MFTDFWVTARQISGLERMGSFQDVRVSAGPSAVVPGFFVAQFESDRLEH